MSDKKISVEDMLSQIQRWHSEVTNFRNDGWTQKGYREKIEVLHRQLATMVNTVQLTTDEPEEERPAAPEAETPVGNITDETGRTTPVFFAPGPKKKG